jgi:general secretion pathway protein E/type IV pilus assembly protein PilB
MVVDNDIQRMIFEKVSSSDLRKFARKAGMRTLREDGLRKIAAGVTTVEEVLRVTMGDVE